MSEWTIGLTIASWAVAAVGTRRPRRTVGPSVAGTWYPQDPESLARTVDAHLDAAGTAQGSAARPVAVIGPHAGFVYSGNVAGCGFRAVRDLRVDRVVLIGPSHYESFAGAAVPAADGYRTPLGEVELDIEAVAALGACPRVQVTDRPFGPEHSLEAEIPFLQRCLAPGWRLVPVLVGPGTSGCIARELADALRPWTAGATLLVGSSDFTHYGPRFGYVPFSSRVPERLRELDMGAIERIRAVDVEGFETYVGRTGATICGRHAIDVLLRLLPGGAEGRLAAYDTSGNLTGDWEHSVSYAAVTFSA